MLKKLFPLYLVIFIGFLGYSLMITVFTPLFLSLDVSILPQDSSLSLKIVWLGIVLFLYPFGQFLSSPIVGAMSDKFGRKPILIISVAASIFFYALIAFSVAATHLYLLCVALFLAGISEGNVTIAQSSIADMTRPKERGKYFGYIYLSASLSYIVGPLIAGKLADPELVSWFSYSTPFWAVTLLLILIFFWILTAYKETQKKPQTHEIHIFEAFSNIKNIFKAKHLRYLFGINFLIYFAVFGFFRSYPMYIVDQFKMGISNLSELIAWVSVPIILVNMWCLGFVLKRINAIKLTLFSSLFAGISIGVIILPEEPSWLWLTLFLAALGIAFLIPSCAVVLSHIAKSNEQGRVMGNNQSLQYLAESISGLIAGFLAAMLVELPMIVFGTSSIVASFLLFDYTRRNHKVVKKIKENS